jgi:hypothetical protein
VLNDAREDYQSQYRERLARDALPRAWENLLQEPDAMLVDLLASRIASLSGFTPSVELVSEFLSKNGLAPSRAPKAVGRLSDQQGSLPSFSQPSDLSDHAPLGSSAKRLRSGDDPGGPLVYSFRGEKRTAKTAQEAFIDILSRLAESDPEFLERFAQRTPARSRNHVASQPENVYPDSPQLLKYVIELMPGWYVGTNVNNRDKERLVRIACEVAGLTFGVDIIISFPRRAQVKIA